MKKNITARTERLCQIGWMSGGVNAGAPTHTLDARSGSAIFRIGDFQVGNNSGRFGAGRHSKAGETSISVRQRSR